MTTALGAALTSLRSAVQELERLSVDLQTTPLLFDPRRLPAKPRLRNVVDDGASDHEPQPTLSAEQVFAAWSAGGLGWLDGLGRRDLAAVALAARHPIFGPRLSAEAQFVDALLPRLRPRRRLAVLGRMWFHHFPPPPPVVRAFDLARQLVPPDAQPRWWRTTSDPGGLARHVASALRTREWEDLSADEELPDEASAPPWADVVCSFGTATDVDHLVRLLRYADRGEERSSRSVLSEGGRVVVQRLVVAATGQPQHQGRVAALLRGRVGDVFGGADDAGWRGLERERGTVRSWVAGQVLDILFRHLTPAKDSEAHQTEPRRLFWRKYTHRVERLWLLVENSLRKRLLASDMRELLDRCGDMVEVRTLEGSAQRAIVWMQLRTSSGNIVTVIEGNANTTFRIRPGGHAPKSGHVHYSDQIVGDVFSSERVDVKTRTHASSTWEARFAQDLRDVGVWP